MREACASDASAIARLATQLGYLTTPEEAAERIAVILPRTRNRILVAEAGGRVVGWIHVAESLTLESGPSAEIAGLVVEERERSAGVGARLLAEAETWAAAAGFARMRVRSNVKRNRARRFYEREGFVVTKQQRNFEKALTRPGS